MEIPNEYKKNLYKVAFVLLIILCVYYAIRSVSEFKSYQSMDNFGGNTITLAGHGEVSAVPDIATISFTIHKEGKTVKIAQDAVTKVEKPALDFLKNNGVEDKDVKTSNASFNQKYEYKNAVCPQPAVRPEAEIMVIEPAYYCGEGKQVLVGYESYETITVKIRKTDDMGKIMQGLGGLGVTDLSGPNFVVENEDALKAEARKKAIDQAKEKAKVLSKDLGVKLGKVMNFSEDGNYPVDPYGYGGGVKMMDSAMNSASAPAQIPKGENTISSDVTITYIIK
jgi:uncharacterized protein YggE